MTLQELGLAIREKREAAGMSIDDVASRIKISGRILRSIEEGSLVGLPHAVYTKSFIRAFGLLVGFAPEELNAHLEELFPPESLDETRAESPLRTIPVSYPGAGKRYAVLFVFLLILAGLAGGGWYVTSNYGAAIWDLVKQPFSAITAPSSGPEEGRDPAAQSGGSTSSSGVSNTLSAFTQSPPPVTTGSAPPVAAPLPGATSADISSPHSPAPAGVAASGGGGTGAQETTAPGIAAAPGGKSQLLITADQACWISSRADGARGRDYTLQPNESFVLTYVDTLELTLGNAGGVSLELNGKKLGRPGGSGQRIVLRFPGQTE